MADIFGRVLLAIAVGMAAAALYITYMVRVVRALAHRGSSPSFLPTQIGIVLVAGLYMLIEVAFFYPGDEPYQWDARYSRGPSHEISS